MITRLLSSILLLCMLSAPALATEVAETKHTEVIKLEADLGLGEVVDQVAAIDLGGGSALAFDKMEKYFEAAKGVLEQYGGDVVDVGLNVLRIEALIQLGGLFFIVLFYILTYRFVIQSLSKWREDTRLAAIFNTLEGARREYYRTLYAFWDLPIRTACGNIVFSIYWGVLLLNIVNINLWACVGVFYPELYAVHKFILS